MDEPYADSVVVCPATVVDRVETLLDRAERLEPCEVTVVFRPEMALAFAETLPLVVDSLEESDVIALPCEEMVLPCELTVPDNVDRAEAVAATPVVGLFTVAFSVVMSLAMALSAVARTDASLEIEAARVASPSVTDVDRSTTVWRMVPSLS